MSIWNLSTEVIEDNNLWDKPIGRTDREFSIEESVT